MTKTKNQITIINWYQTEDDYDFGGRSVQGLRTEPSGYYEILSSDCPDSDLVAFLRDKNEDQEDPEGPWGHDWRGRPNIWEWRCASLIRNENTATAEWRNRDNQIAITTVVWCA